ncbi:hypothetical protein ACKI2N_002865 [Cupriavidus sp. 30B13]|uniref:hypothetical protein n=1 Tax=Cupriavidus sp. 30B13 TaxID=3384241 RepID=UPI003B8F1D94
MRHRRAADKSYIDRYEQFFQIAQGAGSIRPSSPGHPVAEIRETAKIAMNTAGNSTEGAGNKAKVDCVF